MGLQILGLQNPKNNLLLAIHLLCCHCLHAWSVRLGMLNVGGLVPPWKQALQELLCQMKE